MCLSGGTRWTTFAPIEFASRQKEKTGLTGKQNALDAFSSLSHFMSTKINEVINFNDLGERKRPGIQTFNAEHNRK
jgi:hypothetical protein